MKYTHYIFALALLLTCISSVYSQNVEEEVYLHVNSTNIISGETLLFSAFVNSKKTNKPSPLSKILYVELITEDGSVAVQKKIMLENGRGYGDVFVSSMFSTGVYQLIAYTRWMKNFNSYFEVPVTLINPFEKVKITQSTSVDWNMKCYTPKDGILLNQDNRVTFQVTDEAGNGAEFKGKIAEASGESILDFTPTEKGMGTFTFNPKQISTYQAILEDNAGQFHFFDLPKISSKGSAIYLKETNVAFDIKVVSTEENFEGTLRVNNKNREVLKQSVVGGSTHLMPKRVMEPGLYRVELSTENLIIDTQWIYQPNDHSKASDQKTSTHQQREQVNMSKAIATGSYSVSVKKVRNQMTDYRANAEDHNAFFHAIPGYYNLPLASFDISETSPKLVNVMLNMMDDPSSTKSDSTIQYLPDYRGELIKGQVRDAMSNPIANQSVMYSSLGSNLQSIASTDVNGDFLINVEPISSDNAALISLLDTTSYQIKIASNFMAEHPVYKAPSLSLDSTLLSEIVKSSVRTQVENAYFDIKQDSVYDAVNPSELFSQFEYFYLLDDYNRFPNIRETFIEYIPAVAVRKKHGKPVLTARSGEYNPTFNESALILLDGIPIDVESLYAFSPYKVKSIGVIGQRYYLGPKVFDGVISLHTFDGNLHDFKVNENVHRFTMQGVQPKKEYYQPNHADPASNRIPDRREQLYWAPNLTTETGIIDFQFYTSDVTGRYELIIEGFSSEGVPISIKEFLEVLE